MVPEANSLYQQACSAEYKEDYTTAVEKLQQALNLAGNDVMIYTKLAGVYSEMGEYDKALETYSKVLELKPSDGYIYLSIGSIYENQGKYLEALQAYNKVAEMCPEYLYNYLNIANVQYQLRDYKSAIENYNKFLSTYSQHQDARENLASSYVSDGDYGKAVVEYNNLYSKNPTGFKNFSNYGLALFQTKDYDKACEFLEKAVEANPDNTSAHINLALSYQELNKNDLALAQYDVVFRQQPALHSIRFDYGNLLADMGQDEAAVENYKIYIANYPDDARAYQNIGIVYKRLNQLDNTIANYEKALELQKGSRNVDLVEDLAECYHLKHDYTNALKYYDEALVTKKDDYNLRFNKALVLHAMKDYSGAIAIYSELLKEKSSDSINNNLVAAYVSLGEENLKAQNYTLSTEYFEKAIEGGTKDSFAYFGLAKSYRACGLNEKATEYYEKAIAMSPDKTQYSKEFTEFIAASNKKTDVKSTDASEGIKEISLSMDSIKAGEAADEEQNKGLIAKGDANYKSKNYDVAIHNYQDALKINPSDEVTLLKIGNIYKLKNDNKNAISFYKKSIVVNPNYTDGWFNLGLVYANDKNNNKAKEAFHRVIALNPNYGYAYYALGIAYEQDGNIKEALNNYKIFLTHSKDEATTKAVETKIKTLEK
jgi:tetratricopeptide (TPR) repeat protein